MKNTKEKGKLRFLIYKSKDKYIGVCFELGIVEEEENVDNLINRLKNGSEAVVKAVVKNNLDASHLNKGVALKYELIWYLGWVIKFKDGFNLKELRPISNFKDISRLAPSCI